MSGYFAPIRRWFLAKDPQGGKAVADALESWVKANSVGDGELTDTGVTAGTYGDATHVGQFIVTAAGRLASASNVPISVGVTSFNGRTGAVTLLSADVTTALGFTPFDAAGTLAVLHGGTGATTASGARTNLGVAIGTDVQGYSANLTTFAAIAPSANVQSLLGAANYAAIRTQLSLTVGTDVQAFDADLSALAALASTGLIARTGAGTVATRTLTAPAAGITVSNGDGVSGNPTLALANDLAALEALSGTNTIYYRSATDTWSAVTFSGLSFSGGVLTATVAAFASSSETTTGSSTTKAVTPSGLAHSDYGKRLVEIIVTDPNGTGLGVSNGQAYYRIPVELNGMNLVAVAAALTTASGSGLPTIQFTRMRSGATASMLSTQLTIDATETDSSTAATAAVIDTGNDDVTTADLIRVDVTTAGSGAKGLMVCLSFQLP